MLCCVFMSLSNRISEMYQMKCRSIMCSTNFRYQQWYEDEYIVTTSKSLPKPIKAYTQLMSLLLHSSLQYLLTCDMRSQQTFRFINSIRSFHCYYLACFIYNSVNSLFNSTQHSTLFRNPPHHPATYLSSAEST